MLKNAVLMLCLNLMGLPSYAGDQVTPTQSFSGTGIAEYKKALDAANYELELYKQKVDSLETYIKILEGQRDKARNQISEAAPGLMHDLSCGIVGAAAGVILTRGFR